MHYEYNTTGTGKAMASFVIYIRKNVFKQFLFDLFMRKKITRMLENSLNNLVALAGKTQNA